MGEVIEPKGERVKSCNGSCREGRGLDRFINQLTDVWFNDKFNDWKSGYRFGFALLGSFSLLVFLLPEIENRIHAQLPQIFADPELNSIKSIFGFVFFLGLPLFFAGILSWRNEKSGPVRMYLAGLTLPALVWFIVERTVN